MAGGVRAPAGTRLLAAGLVAALAVAAGCGGGGGGGATGTKSEGSLRGDQLPPPLAGKPAPAFRLDDARGGTLASAELHGKPYAVTFLYTRCRDVCPLIGQELRRALRSLGPRSRDVAAVAVSVDPEGDTRAAVKRWLKRNRMPKSFHYLIGARRELKPVWKAYYAAPQIRGHPGESAHTATIWIVDGTGRLRAKYSAGIPVEPADIAHDFRQLLG